MPRRFAPRKHQIGLKTTRVEILEEQSTTANAYGEVTKEPVVVATRWAAVEKLNGSETYFALQPQARATYRFELWYVPGLNTRHQLRIGETIYHIEHIDDNEETEVFAVEKVDTTTTVD